MTEPATAACYRWPRECQHEDDVDCHIAERLTEPATAAQRYYDEQRARRNHTQRRPIQDDHPNSGPHTECQVDHGGRGVRRHCRRGCKWPCPDASEKPEWLA